MLCRDEVGGERKDNEATEELWWVNLLERKSRGFQEYPTSKPLRAMLAIEDMMAELLGVAIWEWKQEGRGKLKFQGMRRGGKAEDGAHNRVLSWSHPAETIFLIFRFRFRVRAVPRRWVSMSSHPPVCFRELKYFDPSSMLFGISKVLRSCSWWFDLLERETI